MRYTYGPLPIVATALPGQPNDVLENALGGKMYQTIGDAQAQTNPLAIYDFAGNALDGITSSSTGQAQWVAEQTAPNGFVRFGSVINSVTANESGPLGQQAAAAAASAATAAAAAQAAAQQVSAYIAAGGGGAGGAALSTYAQVEGLGDYPTTFPPSSHQHPAGQISDATDVGRALMRAADQQAARVAIGAGTGSGTSNLALGTTATTAAAGNHTHAASTVGFTPSGPITAQDVQTAILQAANTGGTSGSSQVLMWRYSAGAYPALPATKPAGVYKIDAIGPTYPTSLPSWVGLGASQIPLSYSKVSVA